MREAKSMASRALYALPLTASLLAGSSREADAQLRFNSLSSDKVSLTFKLEGLSPKTTYIIAEKTNLQNNIENYWVPTYSFVDQVTEHGGQFSVPIPANTPSCFFTCLTGRL